MSDKLSRRDFLLKSAHAGVAVSSTLSAPNIIAKKTQTVRVLGTHVTLQEELRKKAMKDLGINLVFSPAGSAAVLQKASSDPASFDLYEQWSDSINILWSAKAIQGIEIDRLKYWKEINTITKTGKISPQASFGAGDAPYKLLYVQDDGKLGSQDSKKISFMPYVHNVDSFGYNTNIIPAGEAYKTESWAWLLDDRYKGKVGIVNAPTIGIFDMALAAQAQGLMKFKDIGNMTTEEIDKLFSILIKKKQEGHFGGFWSSVPESIDFMVKNRVVIESMFSPGVSGARGLGVPVRYAAPKEGYRAWHGVMCLSSKTQGHVKDAAYEYMNWWLSGEPGAFIARQGYYISNPERSRPLMSKDEWDYWYGGEIARVDLKGTDGRVSVKKGQFRNGGSYINRFSNIAVWNTVMSNYDYSLDKWYEFLNA
ncbi:PotD/PotF family extracellular solute-binding protein [Bacteriovorax sp. DB6_IX]|uniref:ABC transporter substrate-binding protein n=1 Tax=Bacteriovorax sp. DB6_IX TaxID=1353530 RepID=UPI00038A1C4F|nr:extracellular solute-binding protein [Bacteriovorax sp. DB6_IX]EQC46956.1 oligopeptide ABC transporter, oligopeptide-binding protein [Bacteriovorax sp. DB6_IX]